LVGEAKGEVSIAAMGSIINETLVAIMENLKNFLQMVFKAAESHTE
jgi:hypothetical protein